MKTDTKTYEALKKENDQLKSQINALKQDEKQNREFLSAVFEGIQDGISVIDSELNILRVNNWIKKRHQENMPLCGKKCYQAYHNRQSVCPECPSIKALSTGEVQIKEIQIPCSGHSNSWYEISAYPLRDDNGTITGVIEHVKDITGRKKMEEELRKNEEKYRLQTHRLSILLENLPEGILVETPERKVLQVNQKFCQLFGIDAPPEALAGEDCREAANQVKSLFTDSEGFIKRIDEILTEGQPVTNEELSLKDGRVFKRDYVPVDTGNGMIENVWHYRDITKSKKTEQQVQKRNAELRQSIKKIKDINKELRKTKEKAEESDQLKSAFLSTISHEIRTPMNGIMGFAQILKDRELGFEERKEYLGIIYEQSKHLMQIINDIIDISKIEANQLMIQKERFGVNELLNSLYEEQKLQLDEMEKSDVELTCNLPTDDLQIEFDPQRVWQVINNLLDNAMKFTDKGFIEMGYQPEKNRIKFYVQDTGIGIPRDRQKEIFERFRQLDDSSSRNYDGTGLGLTISKNLVEYMGGRMWMDSEEGLGSCFYFTLPQHGQNPDEAPSNENQREQNYNWKGKTILLVEDDQVSSEYFTEVLAPTQAKVLISENGEEALKQFSQNAHINLVLMDIQLPDISGLEVTRKMRKVSQQTPIIAQTAHAMTEDREKCIQAGADEYITKPITIDDLLDLINRFI